MSGVSSDRPAVRVRGASKRFGTTGHETIALRRVDLSVRRGELTLLLGPSGSGKTTLLSLMAGLVQPSEGAVELLGHDVATTPARRLQALRARAVGFVFQAHRLIDSLSVLENVCLVQRFAGVTRPVARARARALLERLGIAHLEGYRPTCISQGERQRVAIARALANDPLLVFADEPTASLDSARGLEVIEELARAAHEAGRCVVVTSHDERVACLADRVLRLDDGALAGGSRLRK